MIEARLDQRVELCLVEQHAGGDQVGVLAELGRVPDQLGQVAPQRRLAAREMGLQHAERGRLVEHPPPGRGVELAAARSSSSGLEQ